MDENSDNRYIIRLIDDQNEKKYLVSSNNFLDQLTRDNSSNYTQLQIGTNDSDIDYSMVYSISKSIDEIRKTIYEKEKINLSEFDDCFSYLNTCNEYIKDFIGKKCIYGIVNDIDKNFLEIIQKKENISQNYTSSFLKNITDNIKQINKSLNLIINYHNSQKAIQKYLENFLKNIQEFITDLIQQKGMFYIDSDNENNCINLNDYSFKSCFLDDNQIPFLFFEKKLTQEDLFEKLCDFYIECIRRFNRQMKCDSFIFKYYERKFQSNALGKNSFYIDEYFKDEIRNFTCSKYQYFNQVIEILKNFQKEKKNFGKKKMIKKTVNKWKYLFQTIDYHLPLNKRSIYYIFENIFNQIVNNNEEMKKSKLSNLNIDLIKGMMIKLTEEYRNKGKYYYFDILFRKAIKTIFNQEEIEKVDNQVLKNCIKKDNYNLNNEKIDEYSLHVQNKLEFFIHKHYNDFNERVAQNEKEILSKKISKFIVHIEESKNKDLIFPYFPYGSLHSLYHKGDRKKTPFTIVNKIVIALEIATALKDLHDNGKYHGNLSSQFIFISSSKDAYIGGFAYNSECELNGTHLYSPYYYHPKEYQNVNDIYKWKLIDIYSFGILLFEIINEISPENTFTQNSTRTKINDILQNNFKEHLMNLYYKENYLHEKENSTIGIKQIIEKCMNEQDERYQSFDEVINALKKLAIYDKNKEEIEYRLENAPDSSEYRCTLSDIVECYYRGNQGSGNDLYHLFQKPQSNKSTTNIKVGENDIIQNIIKIIGINMENKVSHIFKELVESMVINDEKGIAELYNSNEKSDKYWFQLQNMSKYHISRKSSEFTSIINSIFGLYLFFIGKENDSKVFKEIYKMDSDDNICSNSIDSHAFSNNIYDITEKHPKSDSQSKFEAKIGEFISNNSYYYIDKIIHSALRNILIPRLFTKKFHEIIKGIHNSINIHFIKDTLIFNEIGSSFKLFYDNNFHFLLQKTYNQSINKYIREREKNIYKENYSKFIVHMEDESVENKIIIPYFPCGTLDSIFKKQSRNSTSQSKSIELSYVDKFIIALEVAIALKDLHDNGEYHGNLASQFIYISSSKDAYIGGIAYDRKLEADSTKPRGPFYYRAPEIIYPYFNNENESIKTLQLYDVFSYGVLLHEIITEISPEKRMGNKPREERLKLLKYEYYDFLFNDEDNECFDEDFYDLNGDSFYDAKRIITKCMKIEPSERYKSFDEIINELKQLKIYQKNRYDIENRINDAKESSDYQCSFCDLVESYYRGNDSSLYDIEKTISEYLKIYSQNDSEFDQIEGDIIETIFKTFDIKCELPEIAYEEFTNEFQKIIQECVNNKINYDDEMIYHRNNLYDFSFKTNFKKYISKNKKIGKLIYLPITSLFHFIDENKDKIKIPLIWSYYIATEMLDIHSKKIYHGELSTKTIGIYYSSSKKSLIPSVTLYYLFYKRLKDNTTSSQKNYDEPKRIEKYQSKDLKAFKQLMSELYGSESEIYKTVMNSNSFIIIVYQLYNLIARIMSSEKKNFDATDIAYPKYSRFQISYFAFMQIADILENNNYSFKELHIDYNEILPKINSFLNTKLNEQDVVEIENKTYNDFEYDYCDPLNEEAAQIKKQFRIIKEKCYSIKSSKLFLNQ